MRIYDFVEFYKILYFKKYLKNYKSIQISFLFLCCIVWYGFNLLIILTLFKCLPQKPYIIICCFINPNTRRLLLILINIYFSYPSILFTLHYFLHIFFLHIVKVTFVSIIFLYIYIPTNVQWKNNEMKKREGYINTEYYFILCYISYFIIMYIMYV